LYYFFLVIKTLNLHPEKIIINLNENYMKRFTLVLGLLLLIGSVSFGQNFKFFGEKAGNNVLATSLSQKVLGTSCDTVFPSSFNGTCLDSLTLYVPDGIAPYDSGYITGQCAYKWKELAQKYAPPAGSTISDVIVMYALKAGTTGSTSVKVYNHTTAGKPNTALGTSATIAKSAIDTTNFGLNFNNVYHFTTAITCIDSMFISVVIPTTFTTGTDELAIWGENIACSSTSGTLCGWLKYGSTWYSFAGAFGINIDMAILPVFCTTTTGINDINAENIVIYPVPAQNNVVITSPYNITKIKVINCLGQTVAEQQQAANVYGKVNTSELSTGIYILQIETEKGMISKKITINR
jgi:hypothetical protein